MEAPPSRARQAVEQRREGRVVLPVPDVPGCVRGLVRARGRGAPVTPEFADQIGADGFAPNAVSAVDLARGLLAG